MKKLFSLSVVTIFTAVSVFAQTTYYVNDNSQAGDVFTTAVGNDGNNGTPAAPFATLSKAYVTAQPGDTIYMDAGSYTNIGGTVGKSLTIRGANYLISPNDVTDPLTAGSRNAETIINTSTFTIGAPNVAFSGFTFNPQAASQFVQTNSGLGFDNVILSKNIFRINSSNNIINITGKQVNPVVTLNYSITDNRFVKEDVNPGTAIIMRGINGIVIQKNTFTVLNDAANRTETCINLGSFRSDNVVVNQNTAYRQNFMIQGMSALNARIDFNTVKECNRLGILSNNLFDPSVIDITDNIVTDPKGGAPSISYARNQGVINASPNIARIDRNTITLNATGASVLPQALIAPTLDGVTQNCIVYVRDNKLKITGDFSSMASPTDFVAGIRYLNNSRQSVTERNEIEFSGSNFNPANKAGIAIYHLGLTPGTNFDIFNNKITGFPTSLEVQNQATGNYGELPNGVTVNFNNNSTTNNVLCINNGTTGQNINATCNWYGSAAAQDIINKLTISTIQAVPYLTNGTDNDVVTGFQPVPNSCDGYPILIILDSKTNITCNGANNGKINITTSYGKAPFTYTWTKDGDANFVSNNEDLTGLAPGTYRLSVVDGNGSTIYFTAVNANSPGTITATITEPPVLTAFASGTNNLCFAQANGTATVNATGGTTPYTYLWSNGATTQSISNLIAGVYNVTVTDSNGCTTSSFYEVTQPSVLSANATGTDVSCNGGNNGSATVNASGGTLPYTYSWSNGANTQSISTLAAAIYTVTVTDANGCTTTASYEVKQPPVLTANASGTNNLCFAQANGTATVNATGGTTPYTYLWNNGATTQSISNLTAAVYTVTVTDANGCTTTASYEVTQPPILAANATGINVSCYGGSNGTATINATGGTTPYTYLWSNGATTQSISTLAVAIYTVTVTDANGCITTASYEVKQPPVLAANANGADVSCYGGSNGTATVNATGGITPYTYLWSNGAITQNISNLTAAVYTVTVTDANGCTATASYEVTQPPVLAANATGTNVSCNGGSNGTATVNATGGTTPYTYLWSNGATTQSISTLAAAIYTVTVTDANGCTATASYEVKQPPVLAANATGANVSCNGGSNGSATVNATGGTTPYIYLWNNGATTQSISTLAAAMYTITVTDANGCTTTASYEVTQPPVLTANATGINVSCNGGSNGTATVNATGGTTPYTYLWSNGATTQSISNLTAAVYTVTVTDANGCSKTASYQVTQPAVLTVAMTGTVATCNGSATATPAGGTSPYTYLWSNGHTTQTISNVPAGTYTVTVKDANNCTVSGSFTITGNSSINPNTSLVQVSCFGGSNGSITVTSASGIAPYTYNLNGSAFQNSNVFSNLTAGVYVVGIKDATGCSDFVTRTITQPPLLTAAIDSTRTTCFGSNTGRIFMSVSGGSGTKTFSWTGPNGYTSTSQSPANLFAGNYSVLITDARGCTKTLNAVVPSYGEIVVSAVVTNILCRGSLTGAINLSVSGGTGRGFVYRWTGAVTSGNKDLSNLGAANNYNVRITDIGSGCFVNKTYAVTQPAALTLSLTSANATGCNSLGTITATAGGGAGNYQYNINGDAYQTSNVFTGLYAGTYRVGVRDANGCITTTQRNITDNGSDQYENNNSRNLAKPIPIGTTINARIAVATDIADWFTFTTPAGGGNVTYSLIVTHPSVIYNFDLFPGSGNGAALVPVTLVGNTRKDYLLAPGTSYRISVTSSTLSFVCYSLVVAPVPLVLARVPSAVPIIEDKQVNILNANVYPNPHHGSFGIRIETAKSGTAIVEIMNMIGQRIESRKVAVTKGSNNVVRFSNMLQSALIYKVTMGNEVRTGKIVSAN